MPGPGKDNASRPKRGFPLVSAWSKDPSSAFGYTFPFGKAWGNLFVALPSPFNNHQKGHFFLGSLVAIIGLALQVSKCWTDASLVSLKLMAALLSLEAAIVLRVSAFVS